MLNPKQRLSRQDSGAQMAEEGAERPSRKAEWAIFGLGCCMGALLMVLLLLIALCVATYFLMKNDTKNAPLILDNNAPYQFKINQQLLNDREQQNEPTVPACCMAVDFDDALTGTFKWTCPKPKHAATDFCMRVHNCKVGSSFAVILDSAGLKTRRFLAELGQHRTRCHISVRPLNPDEKKCPTPVCTGELPTPLEKDPFFQAPFVTLNLSRHVEFCLD